MIKVGSVYKKFSCGCIVSTELPTYRHYFPGIRTPSGNGKRIAVCPHCRKLEATYQYAFKICPDCRELVWAKGGNIRPGHCKVCGRRKYFEEKRYSKKVRASRTKYYQHGTEIPAPTKVTSEPMCLHRCDCLPFGVDCELHCGGCQYFEPEILDVLMSRGSDQYLYAEGY